MYETYEPDSVFLLAPGDVAWKTDLEILQNYDRSESAKQKLSSVVAKYLINRN